MIQVGLCSSELSELWPGVAKQGWAEQGMRTMSLMRRQSTPEWCMMQLVHDMTSECTAVGSEGCHPKQTDCAGDGDEDDEDDEKAEYRKMVQEGIEGKRDFPRVNLRKEEDEPAAAQASPVHV